MSIAPGVAFSPWHHRPFLSFLCAQAAGTIAYQMAGVAVGWHIYDLTRNPFDLGLVGLVQFIPSLLLVLYVGHAADRHDRRKIVSLAQRAESLALFCLAVAVAVHRVSRETILFFVFVIGTARAFEFTTLQTLVPSLVDPEDLPQAMAANSSVRQASAVIGPVLGVFSTSPEPRRCTGRAACSSSHPRSSSPGFGAGGSSFRASPRISERSLPGYPLSATAR